MSGGCTPTIQWVRPRTPPLTCLPSSIVCNILQSEFFVPDRHCITNHNLIPDPASKPAAACRSARQAIRTRCSLHSLHWTSSQLPTQHDSISEEGCLYT